MKCPFTISDIRSKIDSDLWWYIFNSLWSKFLKATSDSVKIDFHGDLQMSHLKCLKLKHYFVLIYLKNWKDKSINQHRWIHNK